MGDAISALFMGDGNAAWDALSALKKGGLGPGEMERICRLLMENKGDRCPLILLENAGDASCLAALVHVIETAYTDYQKVYAARAVSAIVERHRDSVASDVLRRLAELPDQTGRSFDQSDYSWDQGRSSDEVVNLNSLRVLARTVLEVREACGPQAVLEAWESGEDDD